MRCRLRFHVEFPDHGDGDGVEGVGGFVTFAALIVAEEREDQRAAAGSFGETGTRADVFDGTRFGVDASGGDCIFHAIFERAVDSGDGERCEVGGEPRLRLRVFQERDERARGD